MSESHRGCRPHRRSPDGQCLMLSSRDGYCTLVVFDELLPAHHTQQQTLQLQTIAHHHALPLSSSTVATPLSTPLSLPAGLPPAGPAAPALSPMAALPPPLPSTVPAKRAAEPPLTPAASVDENVGGRVLGEDTAAAGAGDDAQEPPKKKRRAALTRVGDLGS